MTIVFENTDTMRCQVQEMARAERMLRDEQIEHEVETYNELIPERASSRRRCSSSSRPTTQLREWLPQARRHRATTSRSCSPTAAGRGEPPRRRGAAHARGRPRRRPLPEVPRSRPSRSAAFATGPVRIVVDHPEYRRTRSSSTDEQRAELARRPASTRRSVDWRRAHPRSAGSIPTSRCPPRSTRRRRLRPRTRARTRARARRRPRARADGHRDRDPAGLRRLRAAALGARAAARRHGASTRPA